MPTELTAAMREGESHSVEFKESLGELREAAQTVVAFANAHGGDLFFGITNDRQVPGVSIGNNTLERLAADLDRHIYPYAPVAIDPLTHENGKTAIRLSVVPDVPPVVGVYLYGSQPLDPDGRVQASISTPSGGSDARIAVSPISCGFEPGRAATRSC